MKRRRARPFEEDDGRTIADMSGISRQPLLFPRMPGRPGRPEQDVGAGPPPAQPPAPAPRPWEQDGLTKQEQLLYMLGAVKAALLVGGVFAAGLGLVVLLFLLAMR